MCIGAFWVWEWDSSFGVDGRVVTTACEDMARRPRAGRLTGDEVFEALVGMEGEDGRAPDAGTRQRLANSQSDKDRRDQQARSGMGRSSCARMGRLGRLAIVAIIVRGLIKTEPQSRRCSNKQLTSQTTPVGWVTPRACLVGSWLVHVKWNAGKKKTRLEWAAITKPEDGGSRRKGKSGERRG